MANIVTINNYSYLPYNGGRAHVTKYIYYLTHSIHILLLLICWWILTLSGTRLSEIVTFYQFQY